MASFGNLSEFQLSIIMFIAVFFGSATCFLINDIADIAKDQHNQKHRPIATGEFPLALAKSIAVVFGLLYGLLSFSLGIDQFMICLTTLSIFLIYPLINHRYGFVANLLVAVCTILSMLYGGLPDSIDSVFYLVMIATFFVIVSREIMLDMLDVRGDEISGKDSLPISMSKKGTRRAIVFGYTLACIPLLIGAVSYQFLIAFFIVSVASLWVPLLTNWKSDERAFALFNIRTSHIYFVLVIIILIIR